MWIVIDHGKKNRRKLTSAGSDLDATKPLAGLRVAVVSLHVESIQMGCNSILVMLLVYHIKQGCKARMVRNSYHQWSDLG